MTLRRRRLSAVLLCLPLLTGPVALAVTPAGAAQGPVENEAKGLRYKGLTQATSGPCKGKFEIKAAAAARGGPARCSHGPDIAPEGIDVRVAREPETPSETAALRPELAAAGAGPVCVGDGTSGTRVQLIYANVSGKADRFATYADSFQVWAAAMDNVFNASAVETGGTRHIRFVHDAACKPIVSKATLTTAAEADFEATIDELYAKGFNRNDRKYVVWMDANVYCGIGEVFNDDRAGQNNYNNVYGLFSRIDNGCWGAAGQSVEAHELMHNIGGVQESAPHSTPYNHCTDERDRMCYADGSGKSMTQVCATSHENVFDCNHDDYFHTAPGAGSYLATHWNAANSAWLTTGAPVVTVPGAPTGVTAVPGDGAATLTWVAPASDGGGAITGYVVTPFEGATAKAAQDFPSAATIQTVTGLVNGAAYTFKVAAVNSAGTGAQSAASATVLLDPGARFNALPPARLLDTRSGTGAPVSKVASRGTLDLQVTGRGGVPASGVSAVVLNVTVTEPSAAGYLTVWPAGEAMPLASNLNFTAGQTVPNLVVAKVGAGGKVSLYNGGGGTHLVADVSGWYGATGAAAGSRYHPVTPSRVLDTRLGLGWLLQKLPLGGSLQFQVTGNGGVPASGVSAVVLNVTVTDPLAGGYLTASPAGEVLPLASNLNFLTGQTVPNLVVVKVGAGGAVNLSNGGGPLDVIADVAGWYGPDGETTGARYHALAPARLLDTRVGNGAPVAYVAPGGSVDLQVTGRGGVPAAGVSAVILNVTVVDASAAGFLTVWPTGEARPLASNLNFTGGQTVPNLVVAKLGAGGRVSLYNSGGAVHLVADVAGWYGLD